MKSDSNLLKLTDKNILLISPEAWEHIFVSKHHYAIHLGRRNNRVFFLNPPGKFKLVSETEYQNVRSVHYTGFPKGLRYFPGPLQRYFIRRKFIELQKLCGVAFDIAWSFDNSVFFDLSALPSKVLTISHIVDSTQNFQFDKAASTASLCLGVTREIVNRLKKANPRSFFVQHGYAQPSGTAKIPLPGTHAVRVGYAGNLDLRYIDWKLLDMVTSANAEVGFYFVGPYSENRQVDRLKRKQNTYFLGKLPAAQLGSFYREMDVLLLCYLADDYPDHLSNAHKMMEYLGSGKVVVATRTSEYEALKYRGLLVMSKRNSEFADKLSQVLQEIGKWNAPEKCELRMRWAQDNSYDRQIDRIEEAVQSTLKMEMRIWNYLRTAAS
ncbi:MAG TPA: glycosyltransferase [Cyclobacteriaceae bacterium]